MASRKPARTTSGQTRTAGTASRPGSGSAKRSAAAATSSRQNGGGRAQNGRPQSGGGGQGGRGQGPDSRGGQAGQPGRATATRARQGAAAAAPAKAEPGYSAPPWVPWTALVLSLGGLGMSIYLSIAHYTTTSILACSNKGYIDCAKVTTSPQSMVFGIFPVAVLGLAFYVFMVAINTPWAWRWQQPLVPWVRTAGIISGIGFVLYLVYAEVIQIGNICLLCTIVHIITFLLFVLLISVAPFFKTQARTL